MVEVVAICAFVAIVICIAAFAISVVNASVRIKEINARLEAEKKEENKNGNTEDDSEEH